MCFDTVEADSTHYPSPHTTQLSNMLKECSDNHYEGYRYNSMTKADLIERIADANGYSKNDAADLVEMVFSVIKKTLERGESIKISGFGNFNVRSKADRRGRNPQTGETITIPARHVLTFKPSAVLCDKINR